MMYDKRRDLVDKAVCRGNEREFDEAAQLSAF